MPHSVKTGGAFIVADDPAEAERMANLVAEFNREMEQQAGAAEFAVCLRRRDGWERVDNAEPMGAFQAAIMAASMAHAGVALAGVFAVTGATLNGPHMSFGRPVTLLASWIEDTDDRYMPLIMGAVSAVYVNAEQMTLAERLMSPDGKETMH